MYPPTPRLRGTRSNMGFFSKKKKADKSAEVKVDSKAEVKVEKKVESKPVLKAEKTEKKIEAKKEDKKEVSKSVKKTDGKIKGAFSPKAYETLLRPLITEKASEISVLNKYVFAINPRMNKIDVKKAIRTIYKVDPVKVNILNFSGRKVRYGKTRGKTKSWKKAVVTLRKGDSIEVYEGV